MAITLNVATLPAEPRGAGVTRQNLLTHEKLKDIDLLLNRITLSAGASIEIETSAQSLVWLLLLDGEATLTTAYKQELSQPQSVLLPPRFKAALSTASGASLLYLEIPDLVRIDPAFAAGPPYFTVLNWRREEVYVCDRDARKRVFMVSPEACGTKALHAAMAIYPPRTMAADFHREGALGFIYILEGRGIVAADGRSFPVGPGDFVYFADRERHSFKAADDSEMRFLTFNVPGEFKTVWAKSGEASRWRATKRDISGGMTAQDEERRRQQASSFGI